MLASSLPPEALTLCTRVSRAWRAAFAAAGARLRLASRGDYFASRVPLLEWARAQSPPYPRDRACRAAAGRGALEVLQWLRVQDPPRGETRLRAQSFWDSACAAAAAGGHLEVLQWLLGLRQLAETEPGADTRARAGEAFIAAAASGQLEVLQWIGAPGGPTISTISFSMACVAAAGQGHLGALKCIRAAYGPEQLGLEALEVCRAAAAGGHLEVLRWALGQGQENRGLGQRKVCRAAAAGGHLEVLQWAHAQDPPSPWSERTCAAAAGALQFEVLSWLRAQRPPCPWSESTWELVAGWLLGPDGDRRDADQALAEIGFLGHRRGLPFLWLVHRRDAGGMSGEDRPAFFGSAESARQRVRDYVMENLYEVFWYSCEIVALVGGAEVDLLERVRMVADRAVRVRPARLDAGFEVLDAARVAEYTGAPEYDDWEGGQEELVDEALDSALSDLSFLGGSSREWLDPSTCRLTDLKYAGSEGPALFSTLVLSFDFPELPEPTGWLDLPQSEDWN